MTLENLKTALQQNNKYIIEEINAIIDYLNDPIYKSLVNDDKRITQLRTDVISLRASLAHDIETANTTLTNSLQSLNDSFKEHVEDTVVHISNEERKTWNNHKDDKTIHVTQEEKDLWNAALQSSKDYAKELIKQLHSFDIIIVDTLPAIEDAKSNTIYFLKATHKTNDNYEEYMAINGQWELIGNTRIDLTPYLTKESFNNTIKDYAKKTELHSHTNKNVLDEISQDSEGNLTYNGVRVFKDKSYYTQAEIDEKLKLYELITDLNTTLKDYEKITDLTKTLEDYVKKTDLDTLIEKYTTTEDLNTLVAKYTTTEDLAKDYAKKTELHKHDNKDVLDKLSADADGNLLYNGGALKSGDVTTQDLNNALANYAQKSALDNYATTEALNDYAKKTDLNQYAKSTDVANTYATKTALDDYLKKTSLSDYAKKSDLSEYAKSTDLHTHENKDTIDKFSTDKEGNLLFNGSKIRGDITKQEVDNLLQGYVKQNEYRVSADEGNIISKHDDGLYASIDDSITFSDDYSDKKVAKGKFFGQDYYETTFAITLDNTNPFKFSHGIERIADVIEIKGYIKDGSKYYPLNFNNSQRFFTGYADENYIYIDRGIFSDIDELEQDTLWLTGKTAYITIRYTLKSYQSNFITKDNRVIITKEGNVFWSLNENKTNLITK